MAMFAVLRAISFCENLYDSAYFVKVHTGIPFTDGMLPQQTDIISFEFACLTVSWPLIQVHFRGSDPTVVISNDLAVDVFQLFISRFNHICLPERRVGSDRRPHLQRLAKYANI